MVTLLAGIFIKDKENISSPAVPTGIWNADWNCGDILNMSAEKFIAGTISSSISITADAF